MKLVNRSLYMQARDAILQIIDKSEGFMEKLPSETELSKQLGVSKNTVREALRQLENDCYIVSRHGVGTFIIRNSQNIKYNISTLDSSTNIIKSHGYTPGTIDGTIKKTTATQFIARQLDIQPGDDVLFIQRVRTADNVPVVYVEDYVPYQEGMLEKYTQNKYQSLLSFLQGYGIKVMFADCTIKASLTNKDMQEKLALPIPHALLYLQQIHYTAKGQPAFYSDSYFLSEKFEFNIIRKWAE